MTLANNHALDYVTEAAATFLRAGRTLVAGNSAPVFHGVADRVLYDVGDVIDNYAVNRGLRNDLDLLFLVTFDGARPRRVEAIPLALDFCRTRLAHQQESAWISQRFHYACAALGTDVTEAGGPLIIEWRSEATPGNLASGETSSDPIPAGR